PPSSTVPPSGTDTVVEIEMFFRPGCWRNWVNGTGWPWEPPSNTGMTNVVIGNSGTRVESTGDPVPPPRRPPPPGVLLSDGTRFRRTNRRSAETTDCTVSVTPVGNGWLVGMKKI